jgi:hypothetical protein
MNEMFFLVEKSMNNMKYTAVYSAMKEGEEPFFHVIPAVKHK